MFSYYGSKSKIVDYYPPPKFDKIIEPFAGSARYSLKYWYKEIVLIDKYTVITDLWEFLKNCSEKDVLSLPSFKKGEKFPESLTGNERNLVIFNLKRGQPSPTANHATYEKCESVWSFRKKQIAKDLFKIKHWKIINDSYLNINNELATWFIDPPYQYGGKAYVENQIDFSQLSGWCRNRLGQCIVCENTKADWLNFKPVIKIEGAGHTKTVEAIWSNYKTNYDNIQQKLFES